MDPRKREEMEFHNQLRDPALRQDGARYRHLTANRKYYSVATSSVAYYQNWLKERCAGKQVLDYGCGDGAYSCFLSHHGAYVTGIDISDVSVKNCDVRVHAEGVPERARFRVMDCEALEFEDNTFDIVCEAGVLHHLDFRRALAEIARVVKPNGSAICYEALGHNPLIQLYRRSTPHLRTGYETNHILRLSHLEVAQEYFGCVTVEFFHLATFAAVPFRNTSLFQALLRALETIDSLLLKIPGIRSQAWMVIFVLSQPKKKLTR